MGISITVNGKRHLLTVAADTPLLYVLRNDLQLNGPKFGCGEAQCGACTVMVGKDATPSCVFPVGAVGAAQVTTIEGLGHGEHLHALQRAFLAEQAAQCGYCSSGMLMAAKALLERIPDPDPATIRRKLAGQKCRCGTHNRIVRAIQRAAQELRG
ncbi:2Fe-2S iron-sulfur cluster binding domain-containing protein [Paraburkholderia sp. 1N]|uniref:2Fe-2S iron-sulfur cluster binding domain-containing protein n=1 Tax=Paraburkholderia solitsugae TaxID=2675748 RepID=A0ABX2BZU0_9BURK|nr:(2Fe-2S)-binding protein [Paraburkholderia solitsugae]NPT46352.1 2Fe-2S iron-sulfur cluster binding domain-containing protein [Paraburkholderia solitsugae]